MGFFEQTFCVWFHPTDAVRRLCRHSARQFGLVWLAATFPLILLIAAKSAVWVAIALWGVWGACWLLSALFIHALAPRRFSRPQLRDWLCVSAYAHLPVWVITPFAALGKAGFATAVLVGLAWVLWLEGKALSRLYNRSFHVAMKLTLLPLAAPVVALMAAFGIMAGAVLSFLGSIL